MSSFRHRKTAIDEGRHFPSFHGGNRGSNPRGDARKIKQFLLHTFADAALCRAGVAKASRPKLVEWRYVGEETPRRDRPLLCA